MSDDPTPIPARLPSIAILRLSPEQGLLVQRVSEYLECNTHEAVLTLALLGAAHPFKSEEDRYLGLSSCLYLAKHGAGAFTDDAATASHLTREGSR